MVLTKGNIIKNFCLASTLNFTCYFFKKQYNRNFVIGDHHRQITNALNKVLKGEVTRLIINIAPRYGKTELAVKSFIANGLALNPSAKFIHLSYSDDLALDNSEAVKDLVTSSDFTDIFPDVILKSGSASKKKWYTTQGGGVYATAAGGQVTGFGAGQVPDTSLSVKQEFDEEMSDMIPQASGGVFGGALIIDDPIKPDDADSETVRERVNGRYDSTIVNRVNSRDTPIIIIMQRLHERDLCGYVLENYPGEWTVLSLPCIITTDDQKLEDGKALWEFKHTLNELLQMNKINPINFGRQYMQNPQPREGLLYSEFKTYISIPASRTAVIKNYTDTADTGSDFLCSISYMETELACYVLDVVYTQEAMETTEPMTAQSLTRQNVQIARVESNNGGRGFARNVAAQCILSGNTRTKVEWFFQSENKQVRIWTKSADVNNLVIFPHGWETRWPVFYKHVTTYSAKGKNAHDDAQDTLTGIAEYFGKDLQQTNSSALKAFG